MNFKIILITTLILCFVGAELYNSGEVTKEELGDALENVSYDNLNFSLDKEGNNENNTFIKRAIYKYADFLAFFVTMGFSETIKYGYDHPQYNYELAWKLLFISLFITFIIPLMHLICFIGYFIKKIWVWYKKRKTANFRGN